MTSWFQTEECHAFYQSLSFIEPFRCSVMRDDAEKGRIVGYIQKDGSKLKQFFSRRAIINGGPMLADDITDEELTELLTKCKKQLKGEAIYIETRNFDDYSRYKNVFLKCGFTYKPHYNFHVDCTDWERVEANIGKHRKKYIRLSMRDGAIIVEKPTLEQVHEFYEILKDLYKTKVKMPLWPLSFFEKLYQSPFGRFLLIDYDGHIIGGSACVEMKGQCIYEWFACGKDGLYKNIHPSSLTKYAGMKYASENGFPRFDMMGAGAPSDGGYGVRDFKAEFGGQLVEHGRFQCVINPILFWIGKLGVTLLKIK